MTPWDRVDREREILDPSRPDELFDNAWYLETYPDVAAVSADGWPHFVRHGELEGRSPGPGFDAEFYRGTHLPLEGDRPFTHYVAVGRARGHAPRATELSATATMQGILAALQGRLNPILLIGNDARPAGGPLLLLEIARRLTDRGRSPIILLRQGGPLFPEFAALGPTLVADEGWDLPALGACLPAEVPILANTGWGAFLAAELGVASRTVVLVHEMPGYLVDHGLLEPIGLAHTVVASMPRVEAELARSLPTSPELRTVVPGLRAPVTSRSGARRVRRLIDRSFGPVSSVYLGAGYADHRKGFDLFLDAATSLAQQDEHAVFVWLGDLGAWARELADRAVAEGLRLLLPGFRSDAADWYSVADVYLLTSRQDPGPTTVMDAAAVGTPFVGLAADIGLRDLVDVIGATGEFVDDTDALAMRATEFARSETPRTREERARFIRTYRSLDTYVDDIERLVERVTPGAALTGAVARRRVRARLAVLRLVNDPRYRRTAGAIGELWGETAVRVKSLAPRAATSVNAAFKKRLVSMAVVQPMSVSIDSEREDGPRAGELRDARGPEPVIAALEEPQDVAELAPGDRAWISSPRLLASLSEQADLHILRRPGAAPWPLIRELESSAGRIARIRQHDLEAPPRWVASGARPPRPRLRPGSGARPKPTVELEPRDSVPGTLSIGVFVHVYYVELAQRIAERLELIDLPVAFYVSTVDEERAEAIRRLLPDATVRVFPNRGRDIAPKIFGFAEEHAAHDVVLHLHTKRSPHRSDLGGWLDHILDCLLPSREGINAILALLAENEGVGMVSPALYRGLGPTVHWGPNRAIAEVLTWRAGWPRLPEDHRLAFPAGSMFWARARALEPLQRLAIPADAFSDSNAADGTLAHAVERLIGVSCAAAGLDQIFVEPGSAIDGSRA